MPETIYWAKLNGIALIGKLRVKRRWFNDWLQSSGLYRRVRRSWCYYHGMQSDNFDFGEDYAIKLGGDELDQFHLFANEFGPNIDTYATYICQGLTSFDCMASTDSPEAEKSVRAAKHLLESEQSNNSKNIDEMYYRIAKEGLVMTASYLWTKWDKMGGAIQDPQPGDEQAGILRYEGDACYIVKNLLDIAFDWNSGDYEKSPWVIVRHNESKWRLIEEHPEKADRILQVTQTPDREEKLSTVLSDFSQEQSDMIPVIYFYHRPCPELPLGRFVKYCGDDILDQGPLEDGEIPVSRFVPMRFLLSAHGYSRSFDAQAYQEALNADMSMVVTNHNNCGILKTWVPNENVGYSEIQPGCQVFKSSQPIQTYNPLQPSPELFKGVETFTTYMERAFGLSAVAKGNVESASQTGKAQIFREQRVQQATSEAAQNFLRFRERDAHNRIRCFAAHCKGDRPLLWKDQTGGRKWETFNPTDLKNIKSVVITVGSPGMRTMPERVETTLNLVQQGIVPKSEISGLLQHGNIEKTLQKINAQREKAEIETERFLQRAEKIRTARSAGQPPPPLDVHSFKLTDDHITHFNIHQEPFNQIERCGDMDYADLEVHCEMHLKALLMPEVQQLMLYLGYDVKPLVTQSMPDGILMMDDVNQLQALQAAQAPPMPPQGPGPGALPGPPPNGPGGTMLPQGPNKVPKMIPAPPPQPGPGLHGGPPGMGGGALSNLPK